MSTATVTTPEAAVFEAPCPDWCTLAGRARHNLPHETSAEDRLRRTHQGPNFGAFLEAFADEYLDEPGVLHFGVNHMVDESDGAVDHTASDELDQLAKDAWAAERWLTDQVVAQETTEDPESSDSPWWRSAPNPPCAPWCETDHPADEFADDSALFCNQDVARNEHFVVRLSRYQGAGPSLDEIEVTDEVHFSTKMTGNVEADHLPTSTRVLDFAEALRTAALRLADYQLRERAEVAQTRRPADLPWWMSEPNPPCSPWCTEEHDADEFKSAGSGSLFCRRTIHDSDTLLVVLQQIHSEDGDGGIESDEPCLRIHAHGLDDVDDITLPAAGEIVSVLAGQLSAATQEATRLVAEVTAR